jgi:hypothetical protein
MNALPVGVKLPLLTEKHSTAGVYQCLALAFCKSEPNRTLLTCSRGNLGTVPDAMTLHGWRAQAARAAGALSTFLAALYSVRSLRRTGT